MGTSEASQLSALIVDDDTDGRELFHIALDTAGYAVTEAENGVRALAILQDRTFSLMILDLQMPELPGHVVLQKVRADARHATMTIVVASANAHMMLNDVQDLADYVIYKPFNLMEFIRLAERLKKSRLQD